jgi:hypothetical protein
METIEARPGRGRRRIWLVALAAAALAMYAATLVHYSHFLP